ncbi:hypothetical protein ACHAXT_007675 [Thalassiosira profunda]
MRLTGGAAAHNPAMPTTPRPVVIAVLAGFVATPRGVGAPILAGHATRPSTRLQHNLQGGYLLSLERGSRKSEEDEEDIATSKCGSGEIGGGDPYAPGVAKKYSLATSSETDGFDESADAVGPGIYGGSVQRTPTAPPQHENHNHRPGPLYDGKGYSLMARAIHAGPEKVTQLLGDFPQLVEEVATGGARPLHICGMSPKGQACTQTLIEAGASVHAVDTYGYTALHRMASNDLEVGAEALVRAGLDPNEELEGADSTPVEIAKRQRAIRFLITMQRLGHYD